MLVMASSNSTSTCLISGDFNNPNNTELPGSIVPVWTLLAWVNGIAAPFTVIFNVLIIWTILGNHQLRSKSYNILLSALAVSDLIVGLVVQPLYCWFFVCVLTNCGAQCIISAVAALFAVICIALTLCTMTMLSVERYLAIQLPIFHLVHVTTKRVMIVAVALWVTLPSITLILRILLNNSETLKRLPALKLALGNVLVILYCTAKVHITAYYKTHANIIPQAASQQTQQEQDEDRNRQIEEYKRVFTMGLLVLISIICYIPFITVNIIQTVSEATLEFKTIAHNTAITFILLQSLINPVVMSLRIKRIREHLKAKLMCSSNP